MPRPGHKRGISGVVVEHKKNTAYLTSTFLASERYRRAPRPAEGGARGELSKHSQTLGALLASYLSSLFSLLACAWVDVCLRVSRSRFLHSSCVSFFSRPFPPISHLPLLSRAPLSYSLPFFLVSHPFRRFLPHPLRPLSLPRLPCFALTEVPRGTLSKLYFG